MCEQGQTLAVILHQLELILTRGGCSLRAAMSTSHLGPSWCRAQRGSERNAPATRKNRAKSLDGSVTQKHTSHWSLEKPSRYLDLCARLFMKLGKLDGDLFLCIIWFHASAKIIVNIISRSNTLRTGVNHGCMGAYPPPPPHTHTHSRKRLQSGIWVFTQGNRAYSIICFWKTCFSFFWYIY